ncbi:MAG: replication restart DNA helicase PriA [Trichocoleus desertorum ATA4-8-CV12]|jgi:ribosomal protein S27AE|nr:replication restart DNA helicase PriA [Trichocoleus desertorum ATA4-8-CV12]
MRVLETLQVVRCPNCGSHAERYHLSDDHLTRTQCQTCDYLMITCTITGKVIEAYAPGIYARH